MSYNVNLQHIIFRTKNSQPTLPEESKRQMLAYITDDSKRLDAKVYRINIYKNHVHILVDLGTNNNVASYVKTIKANSSRVFHRHRDFPYFVGWARKYGSFSISRWDTAQIINYIKNQEEHHRHKTFAEELAELFGQNVFTDAWWRHDWLDEDAVSSGCPNGHDSEEE